MENLINHIRKVDKKIFKKPLIVYKITSDSALIYSLKIIQYLLDLECFQKIYVEDLTVIRAGLVEKREELNFLKETKKEALKKIYEFKLKQNKPDLCIVIGGDGTILWANHIFKREERPPFLAFNLGTLGYMATYCAECYKCILDDVLDPKTPIYYETRTFLKGQFFDKNKSKDSVDLKQNLNLKLKQSSSLKNANNSDSNDNLSFCEEQEKNLENLNLSDGEIKNSNENIKKLENQIEHCSELQIDNQNQCDNRIIYALNDITIERKDFTHMINTEIYYNNEPFTIIKSNGLILATPTGSTAYSLSAGGTIMHYGLDCLILNSIAPHSLSFRPIAFPRGDKLKFILTPDSKDAIVINDGLNKYQLSHMQGIQVEISDKSVEFVLTQKFFENKSMMWKQKIINQLGWNNTFKNVGNNNCENPREIKEK